MTTLKTPEEIQEQYYQKTALEYDDMHLVYTDKQHEIALCILGAYIQYYQIKSVLDIGAGTGRTLLFLKKNYPQLRVVGIEPVKELREQGYKKGLAENELIDGDGLKMAFKDGEFDLVCEFAVLHHVRTPDLMVKEMLRVCNKGIYISDSNNFGQGGAISRSLKQIINFWSLWKAYNFIRTKGKVYQISEEDGLFYSYSVYNNYKLIQEKCDIFVTNINPSNKNPYRSASHIALLGLKK